MRQDPCYKGGARRDFSSLTEFWELVYYAVPRSCSTRNPRARACGHGHQAAGYNDPIISSN
jgi:hypothetical protein